MKNRRLTIVAFLLCATLIMGIGYAAITGMLKIGGKVTYNPVDVDELNAAVKFTAATAETTVPNCTAVAAVTNDDNATLDVVFNNTGDSVASYTATATYTVRYDTVDLTYPKVYVTVSDENANNYGSTGWDVEVYFGTTPGTTTIELTPGDQAVVTVVVTNDGTAADKSAFVVDIELTTTTTAP